MQGQRGAIGSLSDSINFEYESLATNLDMEPQICWNDLRNSSENTSTGNTSQEGQTIPGWNYVGSSSSGPPNLVGQIGWSPPINTSIGGNIVSHPIVNLNLNNDIVDGPTFVRGSSSGSASQNFDLNEARFHRVGNDNSPKPIGYDSKFHHMSGSSSGSGVFPVEDTDGRALDGRRVSCKRKTLEGNAGQSSSGSGGNFFTRAESSMWRPLSSHFDANSSMNTAETPESSSNVGLPDEVNPRLGLGIGGGRDYVRPLNVSGGPERSHRNYRLRMSSSVQQDSMSNNSYPPVPVNATRHSDISPVQQPLRFVPMNPPIDLMSPIPSETAVPQNQSVTYGVPSQRNMLAHRWNSLRPGISSSSSVFGEALADDAFPDGSSSRNLPRNIGEHPVFAPPVEARNLASHPTHWTSSGGVVISRNTGSSSRSRSSARSQPSAGPSQESHRHPTQYSRRLSDYVRRSLLPTGLPEVPGQSSSSQQQSVPASSQDGVLPASGGNQGPSHSHSRSALWLERQADGTGGIPYLRALAAAGEGRSRIVSEIRNALNSIRRGEGLRIEDLMLLDQSIYFGRAEIHDQHRDMRLDVDNMSYEELLALEERIGYVCTGLTEEVIVKCLKERKHVQTSSDDQIEAEPCCVCQETYKEGEYIGTLDCGHDFHKDCIKQWLSQKNLCPICKTTGLATK